MKWFIPLVFVLLAGCGNEKSENLYAELLSTAPYAAITDSIHDSPNEPELYFKRAVLLNSAQQIKPALADFQKAWSLERNEKYALGAGNAWLISQPDSAAHFVEQALIDLPESLFLKLLLARAYEAAGKIQEAVGVCDEIIAASPEQVNALILKAELLQTQQADSAVVATLEKAYALLPGNRQLAEELAYAYAESGHPRTLTLTDSLIQQDTLGQYAAPFYIKGNFYAKRKENQSALHWYNQTILRDHRYLNAYIEKGKIYFNGGQTQKAMETFQLANTIAPAFPDAWFWIAKCQEKSGLKEEAKLNYQKAYSLDKTFVEAKEAAEKI